MDMGRYLVEAHVREGRPVAELAGEHGVHPSWIYRLLARYRAEGDAGLIPRSRRPKHSPSATSHYHPQTCGKVERFHQTLKKYLSKQAAATSLTELQTQLDVFAAAYNTSRPHRALGRRTPAEVFDTKIKAHPAASTPAMHFRVRHDKVDKRGSITIRYASKLHHIGMGARRRGQTVVMLIADRDLRIVTPDGELIRHLELDPARDYQPQTAGWISTMS